MARLRNRLTGVVVDVDDVTAVRLVGTHDPVKAADKTEKVEQKRRPVPNKK